MSQKTIKAPVGNIAGKPRFAMEDLPQEVREMEPEIVLEESTGRKNYEKALYTLLGRFAASDYCKPNMLTGKPGANPGEVLFSSVHELIKYCGKVYPNTQDNRPISVPELALVFGAVLGTAAAGAYLEKSVTMQEIDAQMEVAWISMHEWLSRGMLVIKEVEARKKERKGGL